MSAEARVGDAYPKMTDLHGKFQGSLFPERVCALRILLRTAYIVMR
jgi:hypothetical protein